MPLPRANYWRAFAVDPVGDRIAIIESSTSLGIYDAATGSRTQSLNGLNIPIYSRFSDDGRCLAAGDNEGVVAVCNARTWKRTALARLGRDAVYDRAFSDDGEHIAARMSSGDLGVIDLRNGSSTSLTGSSQDVNAVAWSHDGTRLASGGTDQKVRLWDPAAGRELGAVGSHDAPILAVWFVNGDRTLCSVDSGGTLKLWTTSDRL